MKAMLKSQMKNVPKEQQEMLLTLVEKNPDFFQKVALEIQEKVKNGKDQHSAAMEVMMKYKDELQKLMTQP